MVSIRNSTALKPRTEQATAKPKSRQPSASKKRKVDEALPAEDDKENAPSKASKAARSSTPPPSQSANSDESKPSANTPGRVGPIRRTSFSCKPDIKPFKGPPGKKVRKTAQEKDEEYKKFVLENEKHVFHAANGSPTYDNSGFELDYNKVADWMRPKAYNKSAMVNGMERRISTEAEKEKRMAEIFFEKGEAPPLPHNNAWAWKDRVSKDLQVPWHKIGVAEFEEWEKRGFKKARKGEYEDFSQEERDRHTRLLRGASLRK